ncbi:unnamed protein product [Diamesa hyperborea]
MKVTRYKKANKRLSFYINNFNYRAPIQVLVDGTFCFAATKNNLVIEDQLKSYLQLELRFITTPCIIIESEKLGSSKLLPATKKLKSFVLQRCGHEKDPLTGSECIKELTKNNHYVVATQDRDLQEWIRTKPGIALLYLHQIVPCLEDPSPASRKFVERKTKRSTDVSSNDGEKLKFFKLKEGLIKDVQKSNHNKKMKKKGGPNPLSCKKKKTKDSEEKHQKTQNRTIEKNKQNHLKLPKSSKAN